MTVGRGRLLEQIVHFVGGVLLHAWYEMGLVGQSHACCAMDQHFLDYLGMFQDFQDWGRRFDQPVTVAACHGCTRPYDFSRDDSPRIRHLLTPPKPLVSYAIQLPKEHQDSLCQVFVVR